MVSKNRELRGIDEIRGFLQCKDNIAVLDAKQCEGLPIQKKGGVWCGMTKDLLRWQRRWKRTHVGLYGELRALLRFLIGNDQKTFGR